MKKITILLAMLFIATISFSQTIIYTEDFESGGGDWTLQSLGDGDTVWAFDTMVVPGSVADFTTLAATFNDDAAGNDAQHDYVQLWHGPQDVSTFTDVTLTYDYALNVIGSDTELLHVSLWDNANGVWINIKTYGEDTDPTTDSIDVSTAIAANSGIDPANLFFGFGYDDLDGGWGWGAGVDNVELSGVLLSTQPANDSIFIHTANAANTGGHITTITHPELNGNPFAKIVVTHNYNPGGTGGIYNDNVDGVWYNGSNWTIFNEDTAVNMIEGASFNIYIRGNDSNVITQVATVANQNGTGSYSYIDNPITNGNPNANLVMDNYWNPNGVYNDHNYGFFYSTIENQWVIYSESSTIPVGAAFNVIVSPSNDNVESFRHQTTAGNISSNWTVIDHVLLNGKPNAAFVFSHNWGASGDTSNVIQDRIQAVWYTGTNWAIYNEDLSAMDENALFNIVVMNSEVASTSSNELTNFTIYPNPVKDNLTIDSEEEITKIEVYNLLGQQVTSSNPKATNFTMDLSNLNAGIYVVKIISNDKSSSQKIIKQ